MLLSRRLDPARAAEGGGRAARPEARSRSRPATATSALRGASGTGTGSSSPGGGGGGAGSSSSRSSGGRAGAASSAAGLPFTSGSGGSSISGGGGGLSLAAFAAPNAIKVYEAGRQGNGKRIVAETVVQAPVDVVWRVLTNWERLADFVPNLESCERLPSPRPGRTWIRQRGCSQGVLWRLEAEAVIEVEEARLPLGRREARFTMIEGDFKEMSGRWVMEPDPSSAVGMATLLRFDISVQPKVPLPSAIVSYVVRAGLPANIQAVARRAEMIAANRLKVSGLARWAGTEDDPPIPPSPGSEQRRRQPSASEQEAAEEAAARAVAAALEQASSQPGQQPAQQQQQQQQRDEGLPSKGPFWRLNSSSFPEAAPLTAARQLEQQGISAEQLAQQADQAAGVAGTPGQFRLPFAAQPQSSYLGVVSIPLPPAGNRGATAPQTQQELNQRQELKERQQASYPAFRVGRLNGRSGGGGGGTALAAPPGTSKQAAAAAEVHLRRLDTFDTLHRRAVAAVTIDAPPQAVWTVLTDYNRLAEFIPNLAVSQRIALPPNAPPNVIRVRQVGYKRMLYMCLHAESVLDLIEKPQTEIQFRQVAGDFERFQGKWMLQGIGGASGGSGGSSSSSSSDAEALPPCSGASQTQLKYAVEIVIPRATRMLGVLEPLLEQTVFEDVPSNLAAIKQRVESMQAEADICQLEAAGEVAAAASLRRKLERPALADMVDDFAVLVAELERCFGEERVLPSRNELREMNRSDLEKAISAHGGPSQVAAQLGWKQRAKGRRPKGYWDSLDNVRAELDEFIEEAGLQPGIMPAKNDFVRAGRYDIARAVERWGGLYELAEELGYATRDPRKPGFSEWQEHISEVAATTGLSGREGLFELAAKTYAARRSMQGSMDGGAADEFVLADILAAELSAAAAGLSVANSSSSTTSSGGNGAAPAAAEDGAAGSGKAKAKPPPAGTRNQLPSFRSEIDEW